MANGARHDLVRLMTTDGTDSGFGVGAAHTEALLEHLAVIDATGSASLRTMLDLLQPQRRRCAGGHRGADHVGGAVRRHPAAPSLRVAEVVQVDGAEGGAQRRGSGGGFGDAAAHRAQGPFGEVWDRAIAASRPGRPPAWTLGVPAARAPPRCPRCRTSRWGTRRDAGAGTCCWPPRWRWRWSR